MEVYTEKELSAWLGKVLQVNGWHDFPNVPDHMDAQCELCGCYEGDGAESCEKAVKFDPMPLNSWPVAMKWRDWAVAEYGAEIFEQELIHVLMELGVMPADCVGALARRRDYLRAAAKCKENE